MFAALQNPVPPQTFHIDENIDTIIKRFLNSLCSKEDLFKVLKHI